MVANSPPPLFPLASRLPAACPSGSSAPLRRRRSLRNSVRDGHGPTPSPTYSNQSSSYQANVDGDHCDKGNRVLFKSGHTNPVMGVVVTATTAQGCCRRDRSEGGGAGDSSGGEASVGTLAVGDADPTNVGQTATRTEQGVILEPKGAPVPFDKR